MCVCLGTYTITDPICSLCRVFHEMQTDTATAVVITMVATVVGVVVHAAKVRNYSVLSLPCISYLSPTDDILNGIYIPSSIFIYFLIHINCIHLLFFFPPLHFSQNKKFHLPAFSSSASLAVCSSLEYLFSLPFTLFVPQLVLCVDMCIYVKHMDEYNFS